MRVVLDKFRFQGRVLAGGFRDLIRVVLDKFRFWSRIWSRHLWGTSSIRLKFGRGCSGKWFRSKKVYWELRLSLRLNHQNYRYKYYWCLSVYGKGSALQQLRRTRIVSTALLGKYTALHSPGTSWEGPRQGYMTGVRVIKESVWSTNKT